MEKITLAREIRRSYHDLLKSPEWIEYSRGIIDEARECWRCGSEEDLQVHHLVYRQCLPWEYLREEVRVLCSECHTAVHLVADLIWVETLRFEPHELEIILKRIRHCRDLRDVDGAGEPDHFSNVTELRFSDIVRPHETQQPA